MNVSPKEFTHNPRTNPECAVRVLRHSRLGKLHRRIYNKLNCILITSKIACYKWKKGSHVLVTSSWILPMEQPLSWTTDYTAFYFETNGLIRLLLSLSPPSPPPPHRLYHSANNTVISSSVQSFSLKIRRYHHRIPEYYWKSWSDQPFMVYKTKDQGVQMQRSIRCFPGILHLRAQYCRASKKFLSSDIMHLTAQCCMCKWQDLISATTKVMQQIYKGIPN